jgi:uncharacterized protein YdeI (YjbR/CyaY-like superfamily)
VKPTYFGTPAAFRAWLEANHATAPELLVGFYKVGSGKPSITWPQSVDQALCFGWIDGVRRSLGAESYTIRFTPRRARSIWSAVNTRRFAELEKEGLVAEAGRAAYQKRDDKRSGIYSFEQRKKMKFSPAQRKALQADTRAWAHFQARPPWYQRAAIHWVTTAKRPETREKRLRELIEKCAENRPIGLLAPRPGAAKGPRSTSPRTARTSRGSR